MLLRAEVAEWQTQQTQNLPGATPWGFESPLRQSLFSQKANSKRFSVMHHSLHQCRYYTVGKHSECYNDPGDEMNVSGNGKRYQIEHSISDREMRELAARERVSVEFLQESLAHGALIIPRNVNHSHVRPTAIGPGVTTKVNANLGNSKLASGWEEEIHKLDVAVRAGADTAMDLSTGGDLKRIRQEILKESPVPIGTVPVYEVACRAEEMGLPNGFLDAPRDLFFEVVEEQEQGGKGGQYDHDYAGYVCFPVFRCGHEEVEEHDYCHEAGPG